VLFRLRREGQVMERSADRETRTDWVWGLSSLAGAEAFLSSHLTVGARYSYDLVRATSLDGLDYSLGGGTFSFYLAWYSR
jgi:opacity protein-like surface antigen